MLELIAKGVVVVGVEVLAATMVIFSAAEAVCPFASVTAKVKVLVRHSLEFRIKLRPS